MKLFNFSTDPTELTSFWACIVGGAVISMAPLTTDQAILQRLFTTKSVRDCRQSVIVQPVEAVPMVLLLYLVGTALFVFYRFNPARLSPLVTDDAIMPLFAIRELSPGISGLIVVAIFAASMTVMSAGINSLTTATTVYFYQRVFRRHETPEQYANVGRIGTFCWGVGTTLLALFAGYLGALALAYNKVLSFIGGTLLGIFLLGILTKRSTTNGSLLGALVGMLPVIGVSTTTEWSFLWYGPIGVGVTAGVGYLLSLCMQPPSPEKIRGLVMGQGSPESASQRGEN